MDTIVPQKRVYIPRIVERKSGPEVKIMQKTGPEEKIIRPGDKIMRGPPVTLVFIQIYVAGPREKSEARGIPPPFLPPLVKAAYPPRALTNQQWTSDKY